jgi:hypothetical protein
VVVTKFKLPDACQWCGATPAREITVQKNGVKTKRYAVGVMACAACERRLLPDDKTSD